MRIFIEWTGESDTFWFFSAPINTAMTGIIKEARKICVVIGSVVNNSSLVLGEETNHCLAEYNHLQGALPW